MAKKTSEESKKLTYRIPPEGSWANAWKLAALIGALGTVASLFGMTSDVHRFAFSWLFAFMTFLAIGLGGLFMTIMLHLTGASWGVTARRSFEMLAVGLPTFAVLFIPIAMNTDELYPWASHHHGDASHEEGHEEGGEQLVV